MQNNFNNNICKLCTHSLSFHTKMYVSDKIGERIACQHRIGVIPNQEFKGCVQGYAAHRIGIIPKTDVHIHEVCACDGTAKFWKRLVSTRFFGSDRVREFTIQLTPDDSFIFYPINLRKKALSGKGNGVFGLRV